MESKKCMIAGLPSSGKSTYIGALWFNLFNCNEGMLMKSDKLPKDTSLLSKLEDSWRNCEKIDRNSTEQNVVDNVEIYLKLKETSKEIALYVPDFWGEKFYNIIDLANTSEIEDWCKEADSLFYMVHDVRPWLFDETKKNIDKKKEKEDVPPLDTKGMSPAAINIMVLKFLFEHKLFKRFVLAVTHWDEFIEEDDDPESPEEWLKKNSPAFYNFVKHYYPNVRIIGLSAQGCDYNKENFDKATILDKTEKGTRAFVYADGISYDLSKPLNFLLS